MKSISAKFLSAEEIASLLTLDQVIEITEEVFRHCGLGEVHAPPKVSLPLQDPELPSMHWINSMPAFLKYRDVVGVKWVNVTSENPPRDLPTTMGVIILNDAVTGMPIAIMDGTWITHLRTGASTAVGARLFARKNAKIVAVAGCGAEGRSNLEAMSRCFDFTEVRAVDINRAAREHFADEMQRRLDSDVVPFDSMERAAADADIILLTTVAQTPVMRAEWAKPGDCIITISGFADLDHRLAKTADKLYLDDTECALSRIRSVGGLDLDDQDVYGDICEVMAEKKAGRERDDEVIVYAPAGMGAVDIGVAYEAFRLAAEKGVGRELILSGGALPHNEALPKQL